MADLIKNNPQAFDIPPKTLYNFYRTLCIKNFKGGAPVMNKVKITVLKTTLDKELAQEYGAKGLGACPMLQEGQVFYADYAKPEGLCDEAWNSQIGRAHV